MGAGYSLKLTEGDSIFNPGNQSIVSDPIEQDYDAFMDEMIALLKYPVPPFFEPVLKECKVTEGSSSDEFEVMAYLDGQKLKNFGIVGKEEDPTNPRDRLQIHIKVNFDRKSRVLTTENYGARWDGDEAKIEMTTRADFATDPFRIDYFWTLADGTRVGDWRARLTLQPLVNQVVGALSDRKVVLKLNSAKMCLECDPIDDNVVSYEQFFDGVIFMMKDGNPWKNPVEEVTETKFKVLPSADLVKAGFENMPHTVVNFDKDKGTITHEIFRPDETRLTVTYFSLTRSPVTIEIWNEVDDKRNIGKGLLRGMQQLMDGAVAKAEMSSSWTMGIF